jgi:hypothetical protein
MITEDYFLRMINQLATVLASVLKLTKVKQYDDALEEVQASSKQLLGMDLQLLSTLTDVEHIGLLSLGERFNLEKCVVIAELLKSVGDIRCEQGRGAEGYRSRLTALSLFLELSYQEAGVLPREYYKEVEKLIDAMSAHGIPLELKKKLFGYYESVGRFDKAENTLFEIVKEDASFVEEGMRFYDRLRKKSDEELEQGNLPRKEIDRSVRDLSKVAGKT